MVEEMLRRIAEFDNRLIHHLSRIALVSSAIKSGNQSLAGSLSERQPSALESLCHHPKGQSESISVEESA